MAKIFSALGICDEFGLDEGPRTPAILDRPERTGGAI
jgi:hypothetical protein